jgi:hypothetical protein
MNARFPPSFRVVPRDVAMNKVARAMARNNQRKAATDYQIYLRGLADGADATGDVVSAGTVLLVAWRVCKACGQEDSLHARTIRGGIGALRDMAASGYVWRTRHITAVDMAMHRAVEVYEGADSDVLHLEYHAFMRDVAQRGPAVLQTEVAGPAT